MTFPDGPMELINDGNLAVPVEPETEAGRALLGTARSRIGTLTTDEIIRKGILAIEAEVRADLIKRMEQLRPPNRMLANDLSMWLREAAVLAILRDDKEAG